MLKIIIKKQKNRPPFGAIHPFISYKKYHLLGIAEQVLCALKEDGGSTKWILLLLESRLFVNFVNGVYLAISYNKEFCCNSKQLHSLAIVSQPLLPIVAWKCNSLANPEILDVFVAQFPVSFFFFQIMPNIQREFIKYQYLFMIFSHSLFMDGKRYGGLRCFFFSFRKYIVISIFFFSFSSLKIFS